jgi:glycosyltransferase involved in cell wall biosynthesis
MTATAANRGTPRIGLDLLALAYDRAGMWQMVYWLTRTMPPMAPDLRFVLLLPDGVEPPVEGSNVEIRRVPLPRTPGGRYAAEQIILPWVAERARLDMLHTIAFGSPVLYRGVRILTVHDLAFRIFPETMPARWRRYWTWVYGPAARGCRRLIAVSESTRSDLVRIMHHDPARIAVVPSAPEPDFRPLFVGEDARQGLEHLNLPERFILYVGTLQPRKDIETLFRTFARIRARDADIHLVISGGRGWGYGDPAELARREGISEAIHFLGFAPPEVTKKLYRVAELLLFTSLYEGFGLPVVEAMCSGLPVVATSSSSIPEVAGNAALLAPPRDHEALSDLALKLLRDPGLREDMVRRGLERSRLFSWPRSAAMMLDVYRDLVPAARQPALAGAAGR